MMLAIGVFGTVQLKTIHTLDLCICASEDRMSILFLYVSIFESRIIFYKFVQNRGVTAIEEIVFWVEAILYEKMPIILNSRIIHHVEFEHCSTS